MAPTTLWTQVSLHGIGRNHTLPILYLCPITVPEG